MSLLPPHHLHALCCKPLYLEHPQFLPHHHWHLSITSMHCASNPCTLRVPNSCPHHCHLSITSIQCAANPCTVRVPNSCSHHHHLSITSMHCAANPCTLSIPNSCPHHCHLSITSKHCAANPQAKPPLVTTSPFPSRTQHTSHSPHPNVTPLLQNTSHISEQDAVLGAPQHSTAPQHWVDTEFIGVSATQPIFPPLSHWPPAEQRPSPFKGSSCSVPGSWRAPKKGSFHSLCIS